MQLNFFAFSFKGKLNSIGGAIKFDNHHVLVESCKSAHVRAVADEEKKKMLRDQAMKSALVGEEKRADAKKKKMELGSIEK